MNLKYQFALAIRERLMDFSEERKCSLHKIASLSDVPYSTICSFLTGKSNTMTLSTLFNICKGLDISLKDFFDDPMFEEIRMGSEDLD